MMAKKKMLEFCPNCQEHWGPGSEEWQFQECDSCGYPNNEGTDIDEFPDEDYGDDEDMDNQTP